MRAAAQAESRDHESGSGVSARADQQSAGGSCRLNLQCVCAANPCMLPAMRVSRGGCSVALNYPRHALPLLCASR